MQSVNVVHGNSRVIKHGKTAHPALIHYNVDGQISLAYLRDVFRLLYQYPACIPRADAQRKRRGDS